MPVLRLFNYFAGGSDKERPGRFFIEDERRKFLVSLNTENTDMECPNYAAGNGDYNALVSFSGGKRLYFVYPLQKKHENIPAGCSRKN